VLLPSFDHLRPVRFLLLLGVTIGLPGIAIFLCGVFAPPTAD
jgi:hypothetical protein